MAASMTPRWIVAFATFLLLIMAIGLGFECLYGNDLNVASRVLAGLASAACIYGVVFLPPSTRARFLLAFFPGAHGSVGTKDSDGPGGRN